MATEKGEIKRLRVIGEGQLTLVLRSVENFVQIVDHLTIVHSEMVVL